MKLTGEVQRIFTGWMFAESPGLHAVEHPVFDVWLTNCKTNVAPAPSGSAEKSATPAAARAGSDADCASGRAAAAPPPPPEPPQEAEAPCHGPRRRQRRFQESLKLVSAHLDGAES